MKKLFKDLFNLFSFLFLFIGFFIFMRFLGDEPLMVTGVYLFALGFVGLIIIAYLNLAKKRREEKKSKK